MKSLMIALGCTLFSIAGLTKAASIELLHQGGELQNKSRVSFGANIEEDFLKYENQELFLGLSMEENTGIYRSNQEDLQLVRRMLGVTLGVKNPPRELHNLSLRELFSFEGVFVAGTYSLFDYQSETYGIEVLGDSGMFTGHIGKEAYYNDFDFMTKASFGGNISAAGSDGDTELSLETAVGYNLGDVRINVGLSGIVFFTDENASSSGLAKVGIEWSPTMGGLKIGAFFEEGSMILAKKNHSVGGFEVVYGF